MAARDYTVIRVGTDSSGRTIWMTQWMRQVYAACRAHPLILPFAWKITVVQGAFMLRDGGGAGDSAGVHNAAGCIDIRTWNLTTTEINLWVRVTRMLAFPFWRRDWSWAHGGMSPHAHGVLGTDAPMSSGSLTSWRSYVGGGDGLAGPGRDYEWRPSPLVLVTPIQSVAKGWLMADQADRIEKKIDNLSRDLDTFRTNEARRDRDAAQKARESKERLVDVMGGITDMLGALINQDMVSKDDLKKVQKRLLQALADDPTIDGKDNPAPEHLQ